MSTSTSTMTGSEEPAPAKAGLTQWLGLAMLALPTLLLATDITVLYLALPHLSADLGPSSTQMLWIIDIYGFLIAGFLITMGTLGDRIGRRKLLMIGGGAFGLAALVAAYAPNAELLIAARALMGVAGATLMPSTLALISNMFRDPVQRTMAIGVWASSFSAGIALGPLVGGGLLENFWWGSVFLIDVPVIALLLLTAPFLLPEFKDSSAGRLDLASVALSIATMIPVIYGIKELAKDGVSALPLAVMAAGLVAGVTFARRQRSLDDPLVDLSLFSNRAFDAALATLLFTTLAMGGIYLFVTQYLQMVEGLSPIASGLWLLPPAIALVISSTVTPALAQRTRPAYVVGGGLAITAAGFLVLTQVSSGPGLVALVGGFLLVYAGLGPAMVLGTDLVVGSAPPDKAGSASALSETSTELGVSLGVATLGSLGVAIYRSRIEGDIPSEVPATVVEAAGDSLPGAVAAAEQLPASDVAGLLEPAQQAFTVGLNTVAGIGALLVMGLATAAVVLLRDVRSSGDGDSAASSGAIEPAGEERVPVGV